jgi:hypothetical protein
MSQSGYTPIQLYRTTTAAAAPTAGNLAAGELAINLTDEKLYFKNTGGTVKLLASTDTLGTVTSVAASGGTTGLTFSGSPITTSGTLTLGGTLAVANGGTGVTTSTGTGSVVLSNSPTLVTPTLGAASATSIANGLGAVGTPSYTFTGDTNTGIFSPGADTLAFVEGGVEAMRIDSSGNVGIGTSSPSSALQVNGNIRVSNGTGFTTANSLIRSIQSMSGSSNQFVSNSIDFYTAAFTDNGQIAFSTGGVEAMRINGSGNVGIGTTSPAYRFDVRSGATATAIYANSTATTAYSATSYNGTGARMFLVGGNSSGATNGIQFTQGGSSELFFGGVQEAGGAASFVFQGYSGSAYAERMRIDSSGNLLVNTTTAIEKLTIGSTTATSSGINQRTTQTDFAIKPSNTAAGGVTLEVGWVAGGQGPLIFNLGGEKARIDSSGNLLVGTTATINLAKMVVQFTNSSNGMYLDETSDSSGTQYIRFSQSGTTTGSITRVAQTSAVNYNTTSDARAKHDIVDAPEASALIDAIQVRSFKWNTDNSEQRYGMIAQELVEVAPEAVHQPANPDEMMGVDYSKLVPMLVKEIQSLRARVAQLEGN